jgi:IclR family pca regulon transcriptional regulator
MTRARHKNRSAPGEGEPEFTESVATGLGVLERFADGRRVLSLAQLTEMLGVGSPSTLHRYTSVLLAGGYLEQNSARSYRLGARAGDLGLAMLGSFPLYGPLRGTLRELRERFGYTASVVVLDGAEAVYVDRLVGFSRGQHEIDRGVGIGARLPAHCTAGGKLLLAYLPPSARKRLIAGLTLEHGGPNRIMSKRDLRSEIERVLRAGLAVSDGELVEGLRSIAAPVSDDRGTVVAAVEVSAPVAATSRETLIEWLGPQLRTMATMVVVPADDFRGTG